MAPNPDLAPNPDPALNPDQDPDRMKDNLEL
jgi:hypothetical protein